MRWAANQTVLADIVDERIAQDRKYGNSRDYADGTAGEEAVEIVAFLRGMCANSGGFDNPDTWAKILGEEVAEAFGETDPAAIRRELVQVAAVATAWVEAIDRRGPST